VQLKAAVVGAGLMGKWHAHSAKRIGAKIDAVLDKNPVAGLKLASQYGARYFQDSDEYFDSGSCDIVHICSPLESHLHMAKRALDSSMNVLVEKPLTATESDALLLVRRAAQVGKLLCPVHQFTFQRGVLEIQAALQKRSAPPLFIEFDIASAGGAGYPEQSFNALLLEILPHPLSVLYKLWPVADQAGSSWRVTFPRPGDLIAQSSHSGIPVIIRISLHARPTRCKMTLLHGQGTITQDFFHGHAVFDSPSVSRFNKAAGPFFHSAKVISATASNMLIRATKRQWAYPGLEALIRQYYASIVNGNATAPISEADIIAIARTCDEFRRHMTGS
jgi:Oxidoreductase family, NAD-binding Rossmann fold